MNLNFPINITYDSFIVFTVFFTIVILKERPNRSNRRICQTEGEASIIDLLSKRGVIWPLETRCLKAKAIYFNDRI